jgi:hypothetical protein
VDLTADPYEAKPLQRDALKGPAADAAKTLQVALDKFSPARPAHLSTPGNGPGGKGKKKGKAASSDL